MLRDSRFASLTSIKVSPLETLPWSPLQFLGARWFKLKRFQDQTDRQKGIQMFNQIKFCAPLFMLFSAATISLIES